MKFCFGNLKNLTNNLLKYPLIVFIGVLTFFIVRVYAVTKIINTGESFPHHTFEDELSRNERLYLGLSQKTNFSLSDMQGTLFIFEIFSTYCFSCPENVPVLNNVYKSIEEKPELKDKVKVIGIAIGNCRNEVQDFKKKYKAIYPILTDYDFIMHKALGNPRVPFTIIVKKEAKGNTVVDVHQGVLENTNEIIDKLRKYL